MTTNDGNDSKDGNGIKSAKKASANGAVATVAAALVKTMDGVDAAVESALTLNHKAIVARRNALPRGSALNVALHHLVETLEKEGPDSRVFASADSPAAKKLVGIVSSVKVKDEDPILVPLTKAREDFMSYRTQRAENEAERRAKFDAKRAEEIQAAIDRIAKKKAAQEKQKADEAAAAAALDEFSSTEVLAADREREDERKAETELREGHLIPLVNGHARVVFAEGSNSFVVALAYEAASAIQAIEVVDWVDLERRAFEKAKIVGMPEAMRSLTVSCMVCTKEVELGSNRAQILQVIAEKPDGSGYWVHGRNHPLAGQPREHRILVCMDCAWLGRKIAPMRTIKNKEGNEKQVKAARYQTAFEQYLGYCASKNPRHYTGKDDEATGEPTMAEGQAPALTSRPFDTAALAAMTDAAGGSDDSKTE